MSIKLKELKAVEQSELEELLITDKVPNHVTAFSRMILTVEGVPGGDLSSWLVLREWLGKPHFIAEFVKTI